MLPTNPNRPKFTAFRNSENKASVAAPPPNNNITTDAGVALVTDGGVNIVTQ